MTREEIKKALEDHQHWLNEDCPGWENMRVNLIKADLIKANLIGANLTGASLYKADMIGANLIGANLTGASLYKADLTGANLTGANLFGANLYGADLTKANLTGANLYRTNLDKADLTVVDLTRAENVPFIPYTCPDFGAFIGFKKASGHIVVLEIPEDARRQSATGRKCRCNKAKVLQIQNLDGTNADVTEVASNFDSNFIYRVGEMVSVSYFDEDRWNECSTGIHFFINRQEAVEY